MTQKRECKNCKGKGHVFDSISVLCPFLWPVAIFEQNDKGGITRRICEHCEGAGYLYIK